MTSKSAAAPASFHSSGKIPSASSSASFVLASTISGAATAPPWFAAASACPSSATSALIRRIAAASRSTRTLSRSVIACAAPSRNVIASWISKGTVTRPSETPRPYSTGTSARKRRNWPARRISSSSRAARPGSLRAPRRSPRGPRGRRLRSAASAAATRRSKSAAALAASAASRWRSKEGPRIAKYPRAAAASAATRVPNPRSERLVGGLERGPEERLVRVEVVGPHGGERLLRRALAVGEQVERERRVGTGPREARRRPELADEEPALGLGDRARLDRLEHLRVRRRRGPPCRASARPAANRAASSSAAAASSARRRPPSGGLAEQLGEPRKARPRLLDERAGLGRLAEDERALGVRERRPEVCLELPGRRRGRAGVRPRRRAATDQRAERRGEGPDAGAATARSRHRALPPPARPGLRSPLPAPAPPFRASRPAPA